MILKNILFALVMAVSSSAYAVSQDIKADLLMTKIKSAIEANRPVDALPQFAELEAMEPTLDKPLTEGFHYYYVYALAESGNNLKAQQRANMYLEKFGKQGKHYQEVLGILSRVDDLANQERQEAKAAAERRAQQERETKEMSAIKVSSQISSKKFFQKAACDRFEMAQDTVDIESIFEDTENSSYAKYLNEFWTTPACVAYFKNDTPAPIIFNTASNTPKNENFPRAVHDYFVEEKHSPEIWLKTINTTTSDGYTFLDYLQYNFDRGNYKEKDSREAALRIISFLCKNGGVYSKYKQTSKCSL